MSDNKNYVRCWTCKSNGVDVFFGGVEERQVHEHTMHASLYQKANSYTRNTISIELILDSYGYFLRGYRGEEVEKLDERIGFTKSTTAQQAPPNAETIDIERKCQRQATGQSHAASCWISQSVMTLQKIH